MNDPIRPNALPLALTSFIGRERESEQVKELLRQTRLLTLTGTGGCGKTRLALEVAGQVVDDYPDGVWLVELAPLADPALVPQAVADVLGIGEQPGQPITAALVSALPSKRLLLVLDNCEHLLETTIQLADAMLRRCPAVRLLVTSRQPLGIGAEIVWRVPSLSLPDAREPLTARHAEQAEAAQLFRDRALARDPAFRLTDHNAGAVAEICARLDGIPLAIELATGRLRALTVKEIAARLHDRFRLLTTSDGLAPPRHRTLRATVEWSHALLAPAEQHLFARLAVFAGGWTLHAAEAIGAGEMIAADEIFDLLARLIDHSLVVAEPGAPGTTRYRLLETLRQFAWERLDERGELALMRERHATYYLALAERLEPATYQADARVAALAEFACEAPNLRAALDWLLEYGDAERGVRLVGALANFWFHRGHKREGRRWLDDALCRLADTQDDQASAARVALARARHGLARLAIWQGDVALARVIFAANVAIYRAADEPWEMAHSLNWSGVAAHMQGDGAAARAAYEESLAVWRSLGYAEGVGYNLRWLGMLAYDQGDYAVAEACLKEGLALARRLGEPYEIGQMLMALGQLAIQQGNATLARERLAESMRLFEQVEARDAVGMALIYLGHLEVTLKQCRLAVERLREALTIQTEAGNSLFVVYTIEGFARVAAVQHQPERALRVASASAQLRADMSASLPAFWARQLERSLGAARQALTRAEAEAAWTAGQRWSLDEAIDEALATIALPAPTTDQGMPAATDLPEPLTPREQEVAILLAHGLSNRAIAVRLSIAERTVTTHVTHILGKLGLTTRGQVALWSVARGLVEPSRAD